MPLITHNPPTVTSPIGNYSHGLEVRQPTRWLFISGQIPETSSGEIPTSFEEQCHAVWDNITAILASADMTVQNLVKVTTFLTHPDHIAPNGAIRRQRLAGHQPVLTVMIAQTLELAWLLEIEAIAVE